MSVKHSSKQTVMAVSNTFWLELVNRLKISPYIVSFVIDSSIWGSTSNNRRRNKTSECHDVKLITLEPQS